MTLSEILLPEFEHEMAATRRELERVPEGKNDWQPHEKSMKLGRLASHVAELPSWGVNSIAKDDLDIMPTDGSTYEVVIHPTRAALLAAFDRHVAAMRSLLASATDAQLMQPWSLKRGGATLFTMPKASVIRNMVLNHMIHHRAQLGVYLRLNDVPLPQMYGPSADERAF